MKYLIGFLFLVPLAGYAVGDRQYNFCVLEIGYNSSEIGYSKVSCDGNWASTRIFPDPEMSSQMALTYYLEELTGKGMRIINCETNGYNPHKSFTCYLEKDR